MLVRLSATRAVGRMIILLATGRRHRLEEGAGGQLSPMPPLDPPLSINLILEEAGSQYMCEFLHDQLYCQSNG